MALVKSGLKSSLKTLFQSPPSGASACASQWASAYASYAAGATAPAPHGTAPTSLSASQSAFASTLTSAFGGTSAAAFAATLASAISAFWAPVVFPASAGPPGVVTGVAGASALQATVAALGTYGDFDAAAGAWADALDAVTKTVTLFFAGVPGSVPPVTGPVT